MQPKTNVDRAVTASFGHLDGLCNLLMCTPKESSPKGAGILGSTIVLVALGVASCFI